MYIKLCLFLKLILTVKKHFKKINVKLTILLRRLDLWILQPGLRDGHVRLDDGAHRW
jgi:hypothetical protein